MNRQRLLENFFKLVRITSPARGEKLMAEEVKKQMTALGLDVTEDEVGSVIGGNANNLFGFLPGTVKNAPRLMFSAHLDTVEPCDGVEPVLSDGVITSRGPTVLGADCKAGLAAILEGVRTIRESGAPHGDIQLVITVAEEGGVNGSKHMDPRRLKADLGYVLDVNGHPGVIAVRAPGKDRIDVVVHGKKSHAGIAPENGVNAISAAARAIARLPMGRLDAETTMNVGIISGGESTNIVPDRAAFSIETRSQNKQKLDFLSAQVRVAIEQEAAREGARAEVLLKRDYEPYALAEDALPLTLVSRAMRDVGLHPEPVATGGGSDANFFNSFGVPTAVLASGMTNVHTVDESILEADLYKLCELVEAIIKTAAIS